MTPCLSRGAGLAVLKLLDASWTEYSVKIMATGTAAMSGLLKLKDRILWRMKVYGSVRISIIRYCLNSEGYEHDFG